MKLLRNHKATLAAATTSAALLGAGGVAAGYAAFGSDSVAVPQVTVVGAQQAASSNGLSVTDVYKRSADSVVEITVSSQAAQSPLGGGGTQQAQGSGFVYDSQGHVITNQHVVD